MVAGRSGASLVCAASSGAYTRTTLWSERLQRSAAARRLGHKLQRYGIRNEKKAPRGALFYQETADQPLDARAARRLREALGVSPPLVAVALLLVLPWSIVLLVLLRDPEPVVELVVPPVAAVAPGLAAPISPAAVPGPARPALSVAAGELELCAHAPPTAAQIVVAANVRMSFLMCTSRF